MALTYRGDARHLIEHPIAGRGNGLTYGAAIIPGPCAQDLTVIFSDAIGDDISDGWEHVSVSTPRRPPNWKEMCFIKDLFWDAEDVVVQFHPPKSVYKNVHPHCLHLWRSTTATIPMPKTLLV